MHPDSESTKACTCQELFGRARDEGKKLPENLRVNMPSLRGFSQRFIDAIQIECASKPQTVRFYAQQMTALLQFAPLADARLCDVDEALIQAFVGRRARDFAKISCA